MSTCWLTNFELFLRTKGADDVQLWRLKNFKSLSASSGVMKLTSDDFEYVSEVKDHMKLISNMFQWNITDYKSLISYISTRNLLVNGENMVISEVHPGTDDDGNELPPLYRRSSHVVSLNTYNIPSIHKRPKVKDVVVVVPPSAGSDKTVEDKLDKERTDEQIPTKTVADLEAENKILVKRVADLEAQNKTLEMDVTKLKTDLAARTNEIADVEVECKTCETNVTKLKADLAARTNEIADLKAENKTLETDVTKLKADLGTKTNRIADLEAGNKQLEIDNTKLKTDLAARTNEIADVGVGSKTCETNVTKLKADLTARTNEIADLKAVNKTLETDVTKLNADLGTKTNEIADLEADMAKLKAALIARTNEVANLESKNKTLEDKVAKLTPNQSGAVTTNKEVWMNDFTTENWVGIEGLMKAMSIDKFTVVQKQGVYVTDDETTNVRARYWFEIKVVGTDDKTFKAVDLQDLIPNMDKARFLQANWWTFKSEGKTYAFR